MWANAQRDGRPVKLGRRGSAISTFNRKLKVAKSVQFDPPLRPNFGLSHAYLGQLWGPTAPKWLGAAG